MLAWCYNMADPSAVSARAQPELRTKVHTRSLPVHLLGPVEHTTAFSSKTCAKHARCTVHADTAISLPEHAHEFGAIPHQGDAPRTRAALPQSPPDEPDASLPTCGPDPPGLDRESETGHGKSHLVTLTHNWAERAGHHQEVQSACPGKAQWSPSDEPDAGLTTCGPDPPGLDRESETGHGKSHLMTLTRNRAERAGRHQEVQSACPGEDQLSSSDEPDARLAVSGPDPPGLGCESEIGHGKSSRVTPTGTRAVRAGHHQEVRSACPGETRWPPLDELVTDFAISGLDPPGLGREGKTVYGEPSSVTLANAWATLTGHHQEVQPAYPGGTQSLHLDNPDTSRVISGSDPPGRDCEGEAGHGESSHEPLLQNPAVEFNPQQTVTLNHDQLGKNNGDSLTLRPLFSNSPTPVDPPTPLSITERKIAVARRLAGRRAPNQEPRSRLSPSLKLTPTPSVSKTDGEEFPSGSLLAAVSKRVRGFTRTFPTSDSLIGQFTRAVTTHSFTGVATASLFTHPVFPTNSSMHIPAKDIAMADDDGDDGLADYEDEENQATSKSSEAPDHRIGGDTFPTPYSHTFPPDSASNGVMSPPPSPPPVVLYPECLVEGRHLGRTMAPVPAIAFTLAISSADPGVVESDIVFAQDNRPDTVTHQGTGPQPMEEEGAPASNDAPSASASAPTDGDADLTGSVTHQGTDLQPMEDEDAQASNDTPPASAPALTDGVAELPEAAAPPGASTPPLNTEGLRVSEVALSADAPPKCLKWSHPLIQPPRLHQPEQARQQPHEPSENEASARAAVLASLSRSMDKEPSLTHNPNTSADALLALTVPPTNPPMDESEARSWREAMKPALARPDFAAMGDDAWVAGHAVPSHVIVEPDTYLASALVSTEVDAHLRSTAPPPVYIQAHEIGSHLFAAISAAACELAARRNQRLSETAEAVKVQTKPVEDFTPEVLTGYIQKMNECKLEDIAAALSLTNISSNIQKFVRKWLMVAVSRLLHQHAPELLEHSEAAIFSTLYQCGYQAHVGDDKLRTLLTDMSKYGRSVSGMVLGGAAPFQFYSSSDLWASTRAVLVDLFTQSRQTYPTQELFHFVARWMAGVIDWQAICLTAVAQDDGRMRRWSQRRGIVVVKSTLFYSSFPLDQQVVTSGETMGSEDAKCPTFNDDGTPMRILALTGGRLPQSAEHLSLTNEGELSYPPAGAEVSKGAEAIKTELIMRYARQALDDWANELPPSVLNPGGMAPCTIKMSPRLAQLTRLWPAASQHEQTMSAFDWLRKALTTDSEEYRELATAKDKLIETSEVPSPDHATFIPHLIFQIQQDMKGLVREHGLRIPSSARRGFVQTLPHLPYDQGRKVRDEIRNAEAHAHAPLGHNWQRVVDEPVPGMRLANCYYLEQGQRMPSVEFAASTSYGLPSALVMHLAERLVELARAKTPLSERDCDAPWGPSTQGFDLIPRGSSLFIIPEPKLYVIGSNPMNDGFVTVLASKPDAKGASSDQDEGRSLAQLVISEQLSSELGRVGMVVTCTMNVHSYSSSFSTRDQLMELMRELVRLGEVTPQCALPLALNPVAYFDVRSLQQLMTYQYQTARLDPELVAMYPINYYAFLLELLVAFPPRGFKLSSRISGYRSLADLLQAGVLSLCPVNMNESLMKRSTSLHTGWHFPALYTFMLLDGLQGLARPVIPLAERGPHRSSTMRDNVRVVLALLELFLQDQIIHLKDSAFKEVQGRKQLTDKLEALAHFGRAMKGANGSALGHWDQALALGAFVWDSLRTIAAHLDANSHQDRLRVVVGQNGVTQPHEYDLCLIRIQQATARMKQLAMGEHNRTISLMIYCPATIPLGGEARAVIVNQPVLDVEVPSGLPLRLALVAMLMGMPPRDLIYPDGEDYNQRFLVDLLAPAIQIATRDWDRNWHEQLYDLLSLETGLEPLHAEEPLSFRQTRTFSSERPNPWHQLLTAAPELQAFNEVITKDLQQEVAAYVEHVRVHADVPGNRTNIAKRAVILRHHGLFALFCLSPDLGLNKAALTLGDNMKHFLMGEPYAQLLKRDHEPFLSNPRALDYILPEYHTLLVAYHALLPQQSSPLPLDVCYNFLCTLPDVLVNAKWPRSHFDPGAPLSPCESYCYRYTMCFAAANWQDANGRILAHQEDPTIPQSLTPAVLFCRRWYPGKDCLSPSPISNAQKLGGPAVFATTVSQEDINSSVDEPREFRLVTEGSGLSLQGWKPYRANGRTPSLGWERLPHAETHTADELAAAGEVFGGVLTGLGSLPSHSQIMHAGSAGAMLVPRTTVQPPEERTAGPQPPAVVVKQTPKPLPTRVEPVAVSLVYPNARHPVYGDRGAFDRFLAGPPTSFVFDGIDCFTYIPTAAIPFFEKMEPETFKRFPGPEHPPAVHRNFMGAYLCYLFRDVRATLQGGYEKLEAVSYLQDVMNSLMHLFVYAATPEGTHSLVSIIRAIHAALAKHLREDIASCIELTLGFCALLDSPPTADQPWFNASSDRAGSQALQLEARVRDQALEGLVEIMQGELAVNVPAWKLDYRAWMHVAKQGVWYRMLMVNALSYVNLAVPFTEMIFTFALLPARVSAGSAKDSTDRWRMIDPSDPGNSAETHKSSPRGYAFGVCGLLAYWPKQLDATAPGGAAVEIPLAWSASASPPSPGEKLFVADVEGTPVRLADASHFENCVAELEKEWHAYPVGRKVVDSMKQALEQKETCLLMGIDSTRHRHFILQIPSLRTAFSIPSKHVETLEVAIEVSPIIPSHSIEEMGLSVIPVRVGDACLPVVFPDLARRMRFARDRNNYEHLRGVTTASPLSSKKSSKTSALTALSTASATEPALPAYMPVPSLRFPLRRCTLQPPRRETIERLPQPMPSEQETNAPRQRPPAPTLSLPQQPLPPPTTAPVVPVMQVLQRRNPTPEPPILPPLTPLQALLSQAKEVAPQATVTITSSAASVRGVRASRAITATRVASTVARGEVEGTLPTQGSSREEEPARLSRSEPSRTDQANSDHSCPLEASTCPRAETSSSPCHQAGTTRCSCPRAEASSQADTTRCSCPQAEASGQAETSSRPSCSQASRREEHSSDRRSLQAPTTGQYHPQAPRPTGQCRPQASRLTGQEPPEAPGRTCRRPPRASHGASPHGEHQVARTLQWRPVRPVALVRGGEENDMNPPTATDRAPEAHAEAGNDVRLSVNFEARLAALEAAASSGTAAQHAQTRATEDVRSAIRAGFVSVDRSLDDLPHWLPNHTAVMAQFRALHALVSNLPIRETFEVSSHTALTLEVLRETVSNLPTREELGTALLEHRERTEDRVRSHTAQILDTILESVSNLPTREELDITPARPGERTVDQTPEQLPMTTQEEPDPFGRPSESFLEHMTPAEIEDEHDRQLAQAAADSECSEQQRIDRMRQINASAVYDRLAAEPEQTKPPPPSKAAKRRMSKARKAAEQSSAPAALSDTCLTAAMTTGTSEDPLTRPATSGTSVISLYVFVRKYLINIASREIIPELELTFAAFRLGRATSLILERWCTRKDYTFNITFTENFNMGTRSKRYTRVEAQVHHPTCHLPLARVELDLGRLEVAVPAGTMPLGERSRSELSHWIARKLLRNNPCMLFEIDQHKLFFLPWLVERLMDAGRACWNPTAFDTWREVIRSDLDSRLGEIHAPRYIEMLREPPISPPASPPPIDCTSATLPHQDETTRPHPVGEGSHPQDVGETSHLEDQLWPFNKPPMLCRRAVGLFVTPSTRSILTLQRWFRATSLKLMQRLTNTRLMLGLNADIYCFPEAPFTAVFGERGLTLTFEDLAVLASRLALSEGESDVIASTTRHRAYPPFRQPALLITEPKVYTPYHSLRRVRSWRRSHGTTLSGRDAGTFPTVADMVDYITEIAEVWTQISLIEHRPPPLSENTPRPTRMRQTFCTIPVGGVWIRYPSQSDTRNHASSLIIQRAWLTSTIRLARRAAVALIQTTERKRQAFKSFMDKELRNRMDARIMLGDLPHEYVEWVIGKPLKCEVVGERVFDLVRQLLPIADAVRGNRLPEAFRGAQYARQRFTHHRFISNVIRRVWAGATEVRVTARPRGHVGPATGVFYLLPDPALEDITQEETDAACRPPPPAVVVDTGASWTAVRADNTPRTWPPLTYPTPRMNAQLGKIISAFLSADLSDTSLGEASASGWHPPLDSLVCAVSGLRREHPATDCPCESCVHDLRDTAPRWLTLQIAAHLVCRPEFPWLAVVQEWNRVPYTEGSFEGSTLWHGVPVVDGAILRNVVIELAHILLSFEQPDLDLRHTDQGLPRLYHYTRLKRHRWVARALRPSHYQRHWELIRRYVYHWLTLHWARERIPLGCLEDCFNTFYAPDTAVNADEPATASSFLSFGLGLDAAYGTLLTIAASIWTQSCARRRRARVLLYSIHAINRAYAGERICLPPPTEPGHPIFSNHRCTEHQPSCLGLAFVTRCDSRLLMILLGMGTLEEVRWLDTVLSRGYGPPLRCFPPFADKGEVDSLLWRLYPGRTREGHHEEPSVWRLLGRTSQSVLTRGAHNLAGAWCTVSLSTTALGVISVQITTRRVVIGTQVRPRMPPRRITFEALKQAFSPEWANDEELLRKIRFDPACLPWECISRPPNTIAGACTRSLIHWITTVGFSNLQGEEAATAIASGRAALMRGAEVADLARERGVVLVPAAERGPPELTEGHVELPDSPPPSPPPSPPSLTQDPLVLATVCDPPGPFTSENADRTRQAAKDRLAKVRRLRLRFGLLPVVRSMDHMETARGRPFEVSKDALIIKRVEGMGRGLFSQYELHPQVLLVPRGTVIEVGTPEASTDHGLTLYVTPSYRVKVALRDEGPDSEAGLINEPPQGQSASVAIELVGESEVGLAVDAHRPERFLILFVLHTSVWGHEQLFAHYGDDYALWREARGYKCGTPAKRTMSLTTLIGHLEVYAATEGMSVEELYDHRGHHDPIAEGNELDDPDFHPSPSFTVPTPMSPSDSYVPYVDSAPSWLLSPSEFAVVLVPPHSHRSRFKDQCPQPTHVTNLDDFFAMHQIDETTANWMDVRRLTLQYARQPTPVTLTIRAYILSLLTKVPGCRTYLLLMSQTEAASYERYRDRVHHVLTSWAQVTQLLSGDHPPRQRRIPLSVQEELLAHPEPNERPHAGSPEAGPALSPEGDAGPRSSPLCAISQLTEAVSSMAPELTGYGTQALTLKRDSVSCLVVFAPPGSGKSWLTRRTNGDQKREVLIDIDDEMH